MPPGRIVQGTYWQPPQPPRAVRHALCGMASMVNEAVKKREEGRGRSWSDYIPLFVLILFSLLAAAALQFPWEVVAGSVLMQHFMGLFLVMFAMFKFFDLEGFADGFQMYDLLAKRSRAYAFVYPFLELGLGLGLLTGWRPDILFGLLIALMVFGALGVAKALREGLDINCACMGTTLKVPLSTVALTEDLGMAAMAAVMLTL